MSESPFGFDDASDSPGFMLWQTTMVWQRLIKKALEPYQVTHPQFVLMASLLYFARQYKEITQVMLIEWTKLDKMTVSKSIKNLANDGYVQRQESATDTRAKCVTLTKKGKALITKLIPKVEAVDKRYFDILAPSKQAQLLDAFKRLSTFGEGKD